jgi:hypothetical protein
VTAETLADIVDEVRPAISNAYYDARNAGETMEDAASRAAGAVLAVLQDSPTLAAILAALPVSPTDGLDAESRCPKCGAPAWAGVHEDA